MMGPEEETYRRLHERLQAALQLPGLRLQAAAVKFFSQEEQLPAEVLACHPCDVTLTSCQALRQATLGDAVCLSRENIGCIAAAITFGLVDQADPRPLPGPRIYTDIMRRQLSTGKPFQPPAPRDFTDGSVYACQAAQRPEFALFGPQDSGRFQDVDTARRAVQGMLALQPPTTQAVFFYPPEWCDLELMPDVVVMSVRPVELTRLIQGFQFLTGQRIQADMGPLRTVNSDLIVRPYVTGQINVSTYCLGARLIARFQADRLGIGMPFAAYRQMVDGVERSATGYPFHLYPGAGS